jgi:hypothetical protein
MCSRALTGECSTEWDNLSVFSYRLKHEENDQIKKTQLFSLKMAENGGEYHASGEVRPGSPPGPGCSSRLQGRATRWPLTGGARAGPCLTGCGALEL